MSDLIDRHAAIDAICGECQGNCIPCEHYPCGEIKALEQLPSEQPERKMGKWVSRENELKHRDWVSCSRCTGIFDYRWEFCPNCGAKMEE